MDIIKIFTTIIDFVKSCWWLSLLVTSRSWRRFRFTSLSLWTGLTDWQSLTKVKTGLQVELQMTSNCITGTERFTNIKCFNQLANTAELWTLAERTGLPTVDGVTSLLTLVTLQTLRPFVFLEQTLLLTVNGLMSLVTLLALETLRLVVLLEHRDLTTFNGLVNWLKLLEWQTLRLVA